MRDIDLFEHFGMAFQGLAPIALCQFQALSELAKLDF
jgi:hypothetical protein